MTRVLAITMLMLLAGCARQRLGLELYDPDVYTRAEADAIAAEMQCKQTARTPVQIARCVGNRRP